MGENRNRRRGVILWELLRGWEDQQIVRWKGEENLKIVVEGDEVLMEGILKMVVYGVWAKKFRGAMAGMDERGLWMDKLGVRMDEIKMEDSFLRKEVGMGGIF